MLFFYTMVMHPAFDIIMYVVIAANIITITVELTDDVSPSHTQRTKEEQRIREFLFFICNSIFIVLYMLEAIFKVRT